jgi:hypothetical protein
LYKFLPIKDNILYKLLNNYFNLYYYNEQAKIHIKKNFYVKLKKLSSLKIFISKIEIKHTNYKIILTLYIYNKQKNFLFNKIKNMLIYNKLKERIKLIEQQDIKIIKQIKEEKTLINNFTNVQNNLKIYEDKRYKDLILKSLEKEILIIHIKQLIHFNKSKFEDTYILILNNILKKLYYKNVEFNIINLKYIHLNSDILMQSLILKLKRRKNNILKVLNKFFKSIKISTLNKTTLINYVENKLTDKLIKNINFFNININKDNINKILFNLYLTSIKKDKLNLENLVMNSLKYKYINGLRLEAKGRLSKRRIASKTIFKFKYKGNLKDIDSSYKGLSTVILI